MGEYVLLAIVLLVLCSYIWYLILYPDDFSNFYYRTNYYKNKKRIK